MVFSDEEIKTDFTCGVVLSHGRLRLRFWKHRCSIVSMPKIIYGNVYEMLKTVYVLLM